VKLSRIDYLRRKWLQDLRDLIKGPYYTMDGTTFTVPAGGPPAPRKAISRGTYEANERLLIKIWLPRDLPVIELGGSFGIVSHTIRAHLNPDVPLVIVEANPHLISTCRHNVGLASSAQATEVVHAALAYGGSRVRFKLEESLHTSHLVFDDRVGEDIVDVPTVTIASLCAAQGISGPFALVCDIEGAEYDMLRHDGAALAACQVIVMETHPDAYSSMNGSMQDLLARLAAMGFVVREQRSDVIALARA
jgi:FkbM family methyltransferase